VKELRSLLRYAARYSPFYRRKLGKGFADPPDLAAFQRRVPLTLIDELLEEVRSGDPYASRCCNASPQVCLQLEYDSPLYLALSPAELQLYAEALRRCWLGLGLAAGYRVAIYDYGTSPLSYLASAAFIPHLKEGAADALGCLPICNDGLPEMAYRAVHILRYLRPHILFLRQECLYPLLEQAGHQGLELAEHLQALVVSANEEIADEGTRRQWREKAGVPVYILPRADAALFLAGECRHCHALHSWPDLYLLEVVDEYSLEPLPSGQRGLLTITNLCARTCPSIRYVSQLTVTLTQGGCDADPTAWRMIGA